MSDIKQPNALETGGQQGLTIELGRRGMFQKAELVMTPVS